MGLSPFNRSCSTADVPAYVARPDGNPNPHRFDVLRTCYVNGAVAVEIRYPDCANYEGRKILVYADSARWDALVSGGVIDPHFTDDGNGPVARSEPTSRGWSMAVLCAWDAGLW